MAQIELRKVSKSFGSQIKALQDVTLDIQSGERVAILGPSGAGKSTLLRTINGLETPSSGQVRVNGRLVSPAETREIRRQVGMIFQRFNLVPRMSVMANVLTGRLGYRSTMTNLFGWFPAEDHALACAALEEVRLLDRAWERADRLSGGQQQRVGIARTLVQQAQVILADEPVASLDPETSQEIMRLLDRVTRERNVTLVVNLHQVELAKQFADRVIGLRAGKLIFDVATSLLSDDMLDELYRGVTTAGEMPRVDEVVSVI